MLGFVYSVGWNQNENSKKRNFSEAAIVFFFNRSVRVTLSHVHFFLVLFSSLRISYLSVRHLSQRKNHRVTTYYYVGYEGQVALCFPAARIEGSENRFVGNKRLLMTTD